MSGSDKKGGLVGVEARGMAGEDARQVQDAAAKNPGGDDTDVAAVVDDAPEQEDGESLIEAAEREAEAMHSEQSPLGVPGRPINRRSPFMIGLLGAAGVATMYAIVMLISSAREVLILIGLALFLAIGLDPFVRLLTRWMPRWTAVLVVTLGMLGIVGGFLAAAIPPLVSQTAALVKEVPTYLNQIKDHNSYLGRLNDRFQIQKRIEDVTSGTGGSGVVNGVVGAGTMVLGVFGSIGTVMVLTIYFLADLPRIRQLIYRLIPNSRRPRAILIGDAMFARVGGFVLGNLITSLIAGIGTFVWLLVFGVPYPLLLALMVALLDLIPIVGSTVGGIIVSLIALSVSLPVAIATAAFYVFWRLAEDYLLVPKVMGKAVEVPATVTFVAVLLGGAILGIVGALIAIPIAAAARIVLQETVYPRLDRN